MAVIHPHEHNLRHQISVNAPAGMKCSPEADFETLCQDKAIVELVLKETNAAGKKAGFKPMETLEAVVLTHEEWTAENGLLTAAQKLQRKKVAEKYKDAIKVRLFLLSRSRLDSHFVRFFHRPYTPTKPLICVPFRTFSLFLDRGLVT